MSLIIPSGFGQAVATFDFIGGFSNPIQMVFGYENTNAVSATTAAQAIGNELGAAFNDANFDASGILQTVATIQQPGDESGLAIINQTGAGTSAALPPNSCFLVHKLTATGGRPGRGRMYWPSVNRDAVLETGAVNPVNAVVIQGQMTDLLLGMSSDFLPMVVLHTSALISPSPVIALSLDALIATQRRRLRS